MGVSAELLAHFAEGTTTLCRCWEVARRDGQVFGFTDHDADIAFGGVEFRANTGLTAHALQQSTGLAVDNAEAVGALSDAAVTETDLTAGRFDGAAVRAWIVNWLAPAQRHLLFSGEIGEVIAGGGGFRAELRGQTERLNQPLGRAYGRLCSADLGDKRCGVDLDRARYAGEFAVLEVLGPQDLVVAEGGDFPNGWFERGSCDVMSGPAGGLSGMVKADLRDGEARRIRLWQELRAPIASGHRVRLSAGCDKRAKTCRKKFENFKNYRGFPHIPGEDWVMAYPRQDGRNAGGSRQ